MNFSDVRQTNQQEALSNYKIQDKSYGVPIPIVLGTARVTAILTWISNFYAVEPDIDEGKKGGKGLFGGSSTAQNSVIYSYYAAVMQVVCEAGGSGIYGYGKCWLDKDRYDSAPGYSYKYGSNGQTTWTWLTSNYAEKAENQRLKTFAYIYGSSVALMQDAGVKNTSIEVKGLLTDENTVDIYPSQCIKEVLINQTWGFSFDSSKIDSTAKVDEYCAAYGIKISPAIVDQNAANEYLEEWATIGNFQCAWSDGKLKFVPNSDDSYSSGTGEYNPPTDTGYVIQEDEYLDDGVSVKIKAKADCYNKVVVDFEDRLNDYNKTSAEAKDPPDIATYGERVLSTRTFSCIKIASVANLTATTIKQRSLYIKRKYTFKLSWRYSLLEPLDIIYINDSKLGLSNHKVRILSIDDSDEEGIEFEAEEMPAGANSPGSYNTATTELNRPNQDVVPASVNPPYFFQLPPYPTVLYISVTNTDPNYGGCQIWASVDGETYKNMGKYYGKPAQGAVSQNFTKGDTEIYIDMSVSKKTLSSVSDVLYEITPNYLVVNGEAIKYKNVQLVSTNVYKVKNLTPAQFSTTESDHSSGENSVVIYQPESDGTFYTNESFGVTSPVISVKLPQSYLGFTIYFKFLSFNIYGKGMQELEDVPAYPYTIGGTQTASQPALFAQNPMLWLGSAYDIGVDVSDASIAINSISRIGN